MKVAVLSYLATYGNAPTLAKAFSDLGHESKLIIRYANNRAGETIDFEFSEEYPCWEIQNKEDHKAARDWIKDVDHVVVVGIPSLLWLLPRLIDEPIPFFTRNSGSIVISSSHLMLGMRGWENDIENSGEYPALWNQKRIKESGLNVFVQPHKKKYLGDIEAHCWYPPIPLMEDNASPESNISIGHTPGKENRWHWKGTTYIKKTFAALEQKHKDIKCEILGETPHKECCERRRDWHIFVDQVCNAHDVPGQKQYYGGLDKSGLEGMATGCAVITSGGPLVFGDDFPRPPVIVTGHAQLQFVLDSLVQDSDRIKEMGDKSREWVRKYCSPEFVASRILEKAE